MTQLVSGKFKGDDEILKAIHRTCIKVAPDTILGKVSRVLEKEAYVVVHKVEGGK